MLHYGEENEIHVHIRSALIEASHNELDADSLAYSWNGTKESLYARKATHSYSWDIMPRAISAGIWRDVELKYRDKYRFRYTYIATESISQGTATMALLYDVIRHSSSATIGKEAPCTPKITSGDRAITSRAECIVIQRHIS